MRSVNKVVFFSANFAFKIFYNETEQVILVDGSKLLGKTKKMLLAFFELLILHNEHSLNLNPFDW